MDSHKDIIYIATDNYSVFEEKLRSKIKEIENSGDDWYKKFTASVATYTEIGGLAAIFGSPFTTLFSDKSAKKIKELNLKNWRSHVESIPFSSIPKNIEFPPGHPLPEHLYKVHPLKQLKRNIYIPIEVFETLLYDEREAELIRLLTDLGATTIKFQEINTQSNEHGANAEAKIYGAGGLEGKGEQKRTQSQENLQVIKLRGKPWTPNMTIDKEKYSWLPFEPSWERLVHTRLVGGALSTTIELTTDKSYSISGQIKLAEGLLQNIGAVGAGATITQSFQKKEGILY